MLSVLNTQDTACYLVHCTMKRRHTSSHPLHHPMTSQQAHTGNKESRIYTKVPHNKVLLHSMPTIIYGGICKNEIFRKFGSTIL